MSGYMGVQDVLKSEPRFWTPEEIIGSFMELDWLTARGMMVRVAFGIYWRGETLQRNSFVAPTSHDVLLRVVGDKGWGYSQESALSYIGVKALDTKDKTVVTSICFQNPKFTEEINVKRDFKPLRRELSFLDVTVLEALSFASEKSEEIGTEVRLALINLRDKINVPALTRAIAGESEQTRSEFTRFTSLLV